jgi:hypothetical protein
LIHYKKLVEIYKKTTGSAKKKAAKICRRSITAYHIQELQRNNPSVNCFQDLMALIFWQRLDWATLRETKLEQKPLVW